MAISKVIEASVTSLSLKLIPILSSYTQPLVSPA